MFIKERFGKVMTKITKRDIFTVIREAAENGGLVFDHEDITIDDVIAQMDKEIANLDKKAATAKEKAAEKKAAGDELRDRVFEVLGTEDMTIAEVTEALNDETVSPNKVAYRLNSLVEMNLVEKNDAKVAGADGKSRVVKVFHRV